MGDILASLWPSTPDLVTSILSPVYFSELRVKWDSNTTGFGISGSPNLTRVPELRCMGAGWSMLPAAVATSQPNFPKQHGVGSYMGDAADGDFAGSLLRLQYGP